ncbi:MAG: bifunctional phosphopantothenoylcysteine decarboxylase/phosphopantothenate--cysteine ligase CoaBC [Oscillospiraceae bacterium]|nr:bifunctional phosphopantothenoylcysteine decarboxylase/phosphopantothenate--cysteine ligase CoaBC [Oscillospiraceae bacterium]
MLNGKTIVIGVSGGIAAYKAVDVVSRLKKLGANVRVVMTRNACEFVAPLTFQSMSQNPVATEMFEPIKFEIEHISLADAADVYAIIPATANIIGKIANGIADDILTTSLMAAASRKPVLIAPAMNTNMYANPIVTENIAKLRTLGYHIAEPEKGRLACGVIGAGKLAKVDDIIDKIIELALFQTKDFAGKTVLVTAGATAEDIDPVRFITNRSTGKMGYALARAAKMRGANVVLIAVNTNLPDISGVQTIKIRAAQEMYDAVMAEAPNADIIIKAAAVGDYRAAQVSEQKHKKTDNLELELLKNPDILQELGEKYAGEKTIVGFCMETENLIENAREKLIRKRADVIVANNLNIDGAGFAGDTNVVTILDKDGSVTELEKMSKDELAHKILDKIQGSQNVPT